MVYRDMDELERWLAAEQGESWDEADSAFAALASHYLPVTQAPAGLGVRIMAALPHSALATRPRTIGALLGSWWVRLTVAAAVLVIGVAFATVSAGQLFGFATEAVGALARLVHGVTASVSVALGLWGVSWTLLSDLGRAAALMATSGAAPLLIGGSLGLASVAFIGLSRLLSPREECF